MDDLQQAVQEGGQHGSPKRTCTPTGLAVTAPRGKNFKPVLLACALAPKDEHGFFYAKDVMQPLRLITGRNYEIPAFAKHLKSFCEDNRGPILQRRGKPYRFIRPIMEPYIVLRGLADGLISEGQLSRPPADSRAFPCNCRCQRHPRSAQRYRTGVRWACFQTDPPPTLVPWRSPPTPCAGCCPPLFSFPPG